LKKIGKEIREVFIISGYFLGIYPYLFITEIKPISQHGGIVNLIVKLVAPARQSDSL
jgi:hypothetical protein|tara:strand:- start:643 stop:813 length:171 start_codon:yes stop_codon:yes gene_type:complete